MQHIVISGKVFLVDEAYLDEPLDNTYPVYQLTGGEAVLNIEAATLQQIATPVPACYAKAFAKRIEQGINNALDTIDIRPVLRLMVNNEKYIHYLCSPVMLSDLYGREGGVYITCEKDTDGKMVVYTGNTAIEMIQCLRKGIPAKLNGSVKLLQDQYFHDALALLIKMVNNNDPCQESVTFSKWKEVSIVPEPTKHERHCKWCLELGLDGNHWANDGIVYEDSKHHTAKSLYIKGVSDGSLDGFNPTTSREKA